MTDTYTVLFKTSVGKFKYTVQAQSVYYASKKVAELVRIGEPILVENNMEKVSYLFPNQIVAFDILR